jgi:hypothetical protein
MWFNGLKVDKAKIKKQARVTSESRYAYYRFDNPRWGAYANAALTPGKIYKIIKLNGSSISVLNDRGTLRIYESGMFYELDAHVFNVLDTESARDTQINRLFN